MLWVLWAQSRREGTESGPVSCVMGVASKLVRANLVNGLRWVLLPLSNGNLKAGEGITAAATVALLSHLILRALQRDGFVSCSFKLTGLHFQMCIYCIFHS